MVIKHVFRQYVNNAQSIKKFKYTPHEYRGRIKK